MSESKSNILTDGAPDVQESIDTYIAPIKSKKTKNLRKKRKHDNLKIVRYNPEAETGLAASQVNSRYEDNLVNVRSGHYSKSTIGIICSNLFTFFNFLCAVCVVALAVVHASFLNYTFVFTYLFNLTISVIQEIIAKLMIEKLSFIKAPTATVIRSGKEYKIPVTEIVLDDVIKLETGDQISADCKILKGSAEINESLLTGESLPVKKTVGGDLLAGSYITGGSVTAQADKIGDDCYIEKLSAKAKKFKKPHSELLNSINWILRIVGILILPIGLGVLYNNWHVMLVDPSAVGYGFVANGVITAKGATEIVTRSTVVIIGMIPAGIFLLTTLALSVGVMRLAKCHTSVQDMYSLEMLARVDVLCMDKTGTITDGRMKVSNCIIFNSNYRFNVNDIVSSIEYALKDNNQTAQALRNYFGAQMKFISSAVIPFSSARKYSAVSLLDKEEDIGTFALGAPEFILKKQNIPKAVSDQIKRYTELGQRVLLLTHSVKQIENDLIPTDMAPLALITLTDNIRADAIQTIDWFKKNEVAVKVISGDNPVTVSEVARRAGVEGADNYISLEGLSNSEVVNAANKYTVFGRVTPEQKAMLVKAIKSAGHTVAMTGDGVNDILAMKESDCSITVAAGSDAAKNIAHLVLLDNNFNSMPQVVAQGRRVVNNIEKSASLYLMKTMFTAIFAIISIIRGAAYPFNNQMMILMEILVIGASSFVLSLQSNTNKVKGKFISYVITHSIPGALLLVFNVYALEVFQTLPLNINIPLAYKDTLSVVVLTFGGIVYLYRVCEPFNLFRAFLYISITVTAVFFVFTLMPLLDMNNLNYNFTENWKYVSLVFSIIMLDFPLSKLLIIITTSIKKSFTVTKQQ